jgi:CelD/BcsL family acetyltransferase involved in cellulose biosynthesis
MLMTRRDPVPGGMRQVARGTDAELEAVTAAADPSHAFLRSAWYRASAGDRLETIVARKGGGPPLAAFPLVARRWGPLTLREVAGCYWPFRSVPLAREADAGELAVLFADRSFRRATGPVWRLGPVFDTDTAAGKLMQAAAQGGWTVLTRRLGTCFEIDLASLVAEGPWPRGSSMKKNRWREKKLAELGELEVSHFTGADWSEADRDAIAAVERNSWLARLDQRAATQFADERQRTIWERATEDPAIAAMVFGSIMRVGGTPAAFTFGIEAGCTRYQIANNFDERFAQHSAGRTLLMRDFERAAQRGIERISWGSGDAGYKSELGAAAGPEIVDLLFVRPKTLVPLLRRIWSRRRES